MTKHIIFLASVLTATLCQAQMIKSFVSEMRLEIEELGEVTINQRIKLKDLYLMDKDFGGLESLDSPLKLEFRDELVYDTWVYTYENLQLTYVNRNGFIEAQEIILFPQESSHIKIGDTILKPKTKIEQLVSKDSGKYILKDGQKELEIIIYAEKVVVNSIEFKIMIEEDGDAIKSIIIKYKTV